MRFGWWIETPVGVEGYTCGWGLYPLPDAKFTCLSLFDSVKTFPQMHSDYTFTGFSKINSYTYYDGTWKLLN